MALGDIIGPVMIGPSSSHTAGAARLAKLALTCWGGEIGSVEIFLRGSFAFTGWGHGTDRALLAGLLGMAPDDPRLRNSFEIASRMNLNYSFCREDIEGAHPNSVRFVFHDSGRDTMEVVGASIGGGAVTLMSVDGFEVDVSGELPSLIFFHRDNPGVIAEVTSMLAQKNINIATMAVHRQTRGGRASMVVEMDHGVVPAVVKEIEGIHPSIIRVIFLDVEGRR